MDKMDSPLPGQSAQLNVDYFGGFGRFEVCLFPYLKVTEELKL